MIPKFRFYNIKLNKIYEVVGIDFFNEQVDCLLPELNNDISFWDFNVGILMQSTGLFDKNGTEIFEGDVVDCYTEGLSTVEFEHGCFGLVCNGYFEGFVNVLGKLEIIGNKFQNKDLLEEE